MQLNEKLLTHSKRYTMKKIILTVAANLAVLAVAQAQTTTTDMSSSASPRPYVGVAVSGAKNQASDDWKASPKVFGGYKLDPNWGVELGYTHHSSEDYTSNNTSGAPVRGEVKGSSSYVAATYSMPVNDRFSAYGKLGASYNERKNRQIGNNYTDRDTGLYGAVGVEYALNEKASIVGEYERYGKDKAIGAKADALSVGVKYGF